MRVDKEAERMMEDKALCLAALGQKFKELSNLIETIGNLLDWDETEIDEFLTELNHLEQKIISKINQ